MPRLSPTLHTADRTLVKGLNEGDETAFAALYDEYGERLYDYALSMSGDEKVAADIVHDTFIDAGRRAPRMRDHLHLSSWLYGAARRRCIRRGRAKILFWDRDAEFADIPFLDRAEPDGPVPDWPPSDELHGLFRAALAKLEAVEQEVLLLAFRHGLRPARLGATLGLSSRRVAMRVRNGRTEIEAALQKEIQRANRACAAGTAKATEGSSPVTVLAARAQARQDEADAPSVPRKITSPGTALGSLGKRLLRVLHRRPESPPVDPITEAHVAGCSGCRRRSRVIAAALFKRAPAPVLPAALRHRVMHTATDPELAGYRADIAARGGTLTPSGLPSQPDVPSPFTRRWMFTGGAMAGALAAALVAVFVMGPGIAGDSLSWPPFRTEPQPSITEHAPPNGAGPDTQPSREPEADGPGDRPVQPPVSPQTDEKTPEESADPTQPAPPSTNPPPRPGDLVVNPAKVELYGTKTAQVSLAAESGPVTWTAMSSTNQLVLSQMQGGMPKDGKATVTIKLRTLIIGLPGEGTLTFTDSQGAQKKVTVVWGASLL